MRKILIETRMIEAELFKAWRDEFISTKRRPTTIYVSIKVWCDLLADPNVRGRAMHDWIELEYATVRFDPELSEGLRFGYVEEQ